MKVRIDFKDPRDGLGSFHYPIAFIDDVNLYAKHVFELIEDTRHYLRIKVNIPINGNNIYDVNKDWIYYRIIKKEKPIELLDKIIALAKTLGADLDYLDYASLKIKKELKKGEAAIKENKLFHEGIGSLKSGELTPFAFISAFSLGKINKEDIKWAKSCMKDPEVKDFIKKSDQLTKKLLKSKKSAKNFLVKNGFATKDGKLHPDYGG